MPRDNKDDIVDRLRFHGRYGAESQDECALRKNTEREEAAAEIERLRRDQGAGRARAEKRRA